MKLFFLVLGTAFFLTSSPLVRGETDSAVSVSSPDPWKLSVGSSKPRPKNARTIIDNDDGAWFDDATSSLEFKGNVVVRDPQFQLFCDRLYVVMNPNRKGLQKIVAIGHAIIEQDNINDQGELIKTIARAGEATYEPATGNMTLKQQPEIQQGMNCQVATEEKTIMILNKKGTSQTVGKSQIIVVDPNKH
ncbi:MAG: LptA/OstA family protein [Chthoniobacterales bacterium]|nr:LptA/OstA family protein [Chthoniobacterales bacterium]